MQEGSRQRGERMERSRHEEPSMDTPFPKSPLLSPMDHAEAVARFRCEIVGALTRKDLTRGELCATLHALAEERFRPPPARSSPALSR
ncbi:MAG: hypothetical protein A2V77_15325 [Anaeromyxobacter sp. RBG_16_69_14]|nr:MAG: hypothetical protein A2V77_15325 [Anaeromyxobacter sp. RBG_16_69_14]